MATDYEDAQALWSAIAEAQGHPATVVSCQTIPFDFQVPTTIRPNPAPVDGGEVRKVSSTGARKGVKPCRPDLIPAKAHIELGIHYAAGALKYTEYDDDGNVTHEGDNNWRLGYEWSKSIAALERHILAFKSGEDFDPEFGSKHVIAAAWHCLTLATFMDDHRAFDDRWSTLSAVTHLQKGTN